MRAITYSQYGPPEVLQLRDIVTPTPKDREVLIRVHAVEVTKTDIELRRFKFAVKWFSLPMRLFWGITKPRRNILGGYFSGEIVAMGKEVTEFSIGDKVFGSTRMMKGAYAEFVTLPADYTLVKKPENMTYAEAAAVPLGGLNALHFMRRATIKPGDKVLINGSGGCIGSYGIRIAKSMGAEVTAIDIGFKEQGLRAFGADHFIDYTQEDFTKSGKNYDVIFDMVPSSSYAACINLLNKGGRYLKGNCRLVDMIRSLFTGWFSDKEVIVAVAAESIEELTTLKEMIEQEKIGSIVDNIYSMEQVVEAHYRVETEQRIGAVVITLNSDSAKKQ